MDGNWDDGRAESAASHTNNRQGQSAAHTLASTVRGPFFWRICDGVLYAEAPDARAVRPPLLSEWESAHAKQLSTRRRQLRWLATRTLAKAVVRRGLGADAIPDIRDTDDGRTLLFERGLPRADTWIDASCSESGRVVAVVSDRPVALYMQRVLRQSDSFDEQVLRRSERRMLRTIFSDIHVATAVGWAVKQALLEIAPVGDGVQLRDVRIDADLSMKLGSTSYHVLGVRVTRDHAIAVVGPRQSADDATRVVIDSALRSEQVDNTSALTRALARAKRIAEGHTRWRGARFA